MQKPRVNKILRLQQLLSFFSSGSLFHNLLIDNLQCSSVDVLSGVLLYSVRPYWSADVLRASLLENTEYIHNSEQFTVKAYRPLNVT